MHPVTLHTHTIDAAFSPCDTCLWTKQCQDCFNVGKMVKGLEKGPLDQALTVTAMMPEGADTCLQLGFVLFLRN